jgi:hypothetical protein
MAQGDCKAFIRNCSPHNGGSTTASLFQVRVKLYPAIRDKPIDKHFHNSPGFIVAKPGAP